MVSKKQLQDLIKTLKVKTKLSQEELSKGAGYGPKTLTQLLSKGEGLEPAYNQLKLVYGQWLKKSTSDIDSNLKAIAQSLARIENGQMYIRAEIRGYGQYQINQQVGWDQQKFLKAMAKVGMLVGANLSAGDLQDSDAPDGN